MSELKLTDRVWNEFKIKDTFDIFTGALVDKKYIKEGIIPRITATDLDNGVAFFTGKISHKNFRCFSNFISISFLGSVFYQQSLVSLDMKIHGIKPKYYELNGDIARFLIPAIRKFSFKYSYGYQLSTSVLKSQKIMLPVDSEGKPDWQFMEAFIKQKEEKKIAELTEYYSNIVLDLMIQTGCLNHALWKEFLFSDIFIAINRGKRLTKSNQKKGSTPYVSSTAANNGVDNFIDNSSGVRSFGNCLTLANSGSVGATFFHHYTFVASDHVTALMLDKSNKYIYLFLSGLIQRLEEKYSFNREINDKRIQREKILLPVNSKGQPDWQFMEGLMRQIEQDKIQTVLKYYNHMKNNKIIGG